MKTSLVFRSPLAYELVMRALYRGHYGERLRALADEVPPGSSVVELCCGTGRLYTHYLRERVSSYVGLDVDERFVTGLRRNGVDARQADLANSREPLPSADVLIIQDALYQFLPDPSHILDRMLAAARRLVIVSERIRNLAASRNPLLSLIGRGLAGPGRQDPAQRFIEQTLDELLEPYRELVVKATLMPGSWEKLYVLRAG